VWNAESEIKTGGGVNYTYDGDGDRVQKSNGKIYWYGAGSQVLDESDAGGWRTLHGCWAGVLAFAGAASFAL
jgi:hypothetical protein